MYEDATRKLGDEDSGDFMISLMPSRATMEIWIFGVVSSAHGIHFEGKTVMCRRPSGTDVLFTRLPLSRHHFLNRFQSVSSI